MYSFTVVLNPFPIHQSWRIGNHVYIRVIQTTFLALHSKSLRIRDFTFCCHAFLPCFFCHVFVICFCLSLSLSFSLTCHYRSWVGDRFLSLSLSPLYLSLSLSRSLSLPLSPSLSKSSPLTDVFVTRQL